MKNKRITTEMVAKALGIEVQTLRVALQCEAFSFGKAVKMPGSSMYRYHFSPGALRRHIGDKLYDEMIGI